MAEKIFNCIICPKCCSIRRDGTRYTGAGCKRGEDFVAQEIVKPRRTLTTTMRCAEGNTVIMIPVKSRDTVPLEDIANLVVLIKKITLTERLEPGTEICINGIPLIAS